MRLLTSLKYNTVKRPLNIVCAGFFIGCLTVLKTFGADKPAAIRVNNHFLPIKMFSSFMIAANGNMADGNRVVFGSEYSNAVDGNDALKMVNPGENFGVMRENKYLAIEARQPITTDTLYYKITNFTAQVYTLMLVPQNLEASGSIGVLVDAYTNTRTTISLRDTTRLSFVVTADIASKAPDRLKLVFGPEAGPLPVKFMSVSAGYSANGVNISWKIAHEEGISEYVVEHSSDGAHYNEIVNVTANSGNGLPGIYTARDGNPVAGINIYRIKAMELNGKALYSDVVKVSANGNKPAMFVYPNPVINQKLNLQFADLEAGNYQFKLLNANGQTVYVDKAKMAGGSSTMIMQLGGQRPGIYTITAVSESGRLLSRQLLIQ